MILQPELQRGSALNRKLITCAAILILSLLTSCGSKTDGSASATTSAILTGDWQGAIAHGREWTAADPPNPVPHYLLNIAHTYAGNRDRARAEFSLAFGGQTQLTKIEKWTSALVAENPSNPYAHLLRGVVHEIAGRNPSAVDSYETALRHVPTFKLAYASLGNLYLSSRQIDKSEEAYRRLSEIDPADGSAHVHLGTVYIMRGNITAAVTEFEKACEMNPKDLIAHYNLANAYLENGQTARAKTTFERVIQLDPEGEVGNDARSHLARLGRER